MERLCKLLLTDLKILSDYVKANEKENQKEKLESIERAKNEILFLAPDCVKTRVSEWIL